MSFWTALTMEWGVPVLSRVIYWPPACGKNTGCYICTYTYTTVQRYILVCTIQICAGTLAATVAHIVALARGPCDPPAQRKRALAASGTSSTLRWRKGAKKGVRRRKPSWKRSRQHFVRTATALKTEARVSWTTLLLLAASATPSQSLSRHRPHTHAHRGLVRLTTTSMRCRKMHFPASSSQSN